MNDGIRLEEVMHQGMHCIAVRGYMEPAVYKRVRGIDGCKYSATNRCWCVPNSKQNLELLKRLLPVQDVVAESHQADRNELRLLNPSLPLGFHERLVAVRYSDATVRTYESQMRKFISYIFPKCIDDVDDLLIRNYMIHLADEVHVSSSTQNTAINAIKFYFEQVRGGDRKVYYLDRPLKEKKLPRVLSEEEVSAMIEVTRNAKHRLMILLMYSSGLRMGELLKLRLRDIDEHRHQLFIDGGKGKKDRYTILSQKVIAVIKAYVTTYCPGELLFEGPGGKPYSRRSVGRVVEFAAKRAGISKGVTPHTLRHSFATHLLEQGVDLRYIQMLLGHESSRTTERYTQMTIKGFRTIVSPLDRLPINIEPLTLLNDKGAI